MRATILCLILIHTLGLLITGISRADDCYCVDCADCTTKLNDPDCSTIFLTQDIIDHQGSDCIDWPADDKIFDCQGHTMDGDGPALIEGIHMENHSGNHIKNCVITNFIFGIALDNASENEISNNEFYYNGTCIYLESAFRTIIRDNYIHSHSAYGIEVKSGSTYTDIKNNTINENLENGIKLVSIGDSTITNNVIRLNKIGINFEDSSFNSAYWNIVCDNLTSDFLLSGTSSDNTGDNNQCDIPGGWNDNFSTGCTYECDEVVPSVSEWGILIIILCLSFGMSRVIKAQGSHRIP